MKKWVLLGGAIVGEVTGTMALRVAIDHAGWIPMVVTSYVVAFFLLALTLREGLAVGVAYGIWGATGVALTALLAAIIFDEFLSRRAVAGIVLIIVGVVLVETGTRVRTEASP